MRGYTTFPEIWVEERIAWALEMTNLNSQEKLITGTLPGGWKQRLALGCALLHRPPSSFLTNRRQVLTRSRAANSGTCRWNGGKGVDFHDSLYRSPLKGVGFAILAPQMLAMALLGVVRLTLSVFRFHKALD